MAFATTYAGSSFLLHWTHHDASGYVFSCCTIIVLLLYVVNRYDSIYTPLLRSPLAIEERYGKEQKVKRGEGQAALQLSLHIGRCIISGIR